jgi:peptidoglycan hydrolase CwlO-like protein
MKRWFTALIALIVGVIIGYAYKQGEVNNLTEQVSALEAKAENATAAATQMDDLKAELEAKTRLADEQQAKISELEAAMRMDELTGPTTATPPPLTLSPDLPTTPPAPQ